MTLMGSYPAAGQAVVWYLGDIDVWFKEGEQLITNNHIPASFYPQDELMASYPPPDPQGNLGVTLAFCALLTGLFLAYCAS